MINNKKKKICNSQTWSQIFITLRDILGAIFVLDADHLSINIIFKKKEEERTN